MAVLDGKSGDQKNCDSSSCGGHEYLYQVSCKFIQMLLEHFALNHICRPLGGPREIFVQIFQCGQKWNYLQCS